MVGGRPPFNLLPESAVSTRSSIIAKLSAAFEPSALDVIDESESHRGHAGYRAGGETHFRVTISAASLEGLTRLAQHRAIMDCLAEELSAGLHALAIEVRPVG